MATTNWPYSLTMPQRREAAAKRTDMIVDLLVFLVAMHETNEIVLYSDRLSGQFPDRSRAANAFNAFRHSMAMFEVMRLAAIWDPAGSDVVSIPTVLRYVCTPKFIKHAAKHSAAIVAAYPPPSKAELAEDPGLAAWVEAHQKQRSEERNAEVRQLLQEAREMCDHWQKSKAMESLRHIRNHYLAHHLVAELVDGTEATVHSFHDGDKRLLLDAAREIVDRLQRALNQGSFDWEGSQAIAKRNAEELWNGCRFEIPRLSKL